MKNVEAKSNVLELTEINLETEVLQMTTPVVVDFNAPWGGPCKMIAPLLERLAGEFAGRLKFAKANVDETPGLTAGLDITGVPTLILFRCGEPVDQLVGFPGPHQLKAGLVTAANAAVTA